MSIVEILTLLYVTIGPTRATAVFTGLTGSADPGLKRKIAARTVLVSTVVCCIFVLVGEAILDLLKVSIPALLIAGGGILFVFALKMVLGDDDQEASVEKIHGISKTLAAIFERAEREGAATTEIADKMAREKIEGFKHPR